jgi:hypothetical protein
MPLPWLLFGQLLVASGQDCPAAAAVDARVREMLGMRPSDGFEERAVVDREGASLRVRLRGKDDRVLGDRTLVAEGTCDELASVVAVVLATWLSDVHPVYPGALPEVPPPQPPPLAPKEEPVAPSAGTPPSRHVAIGATVGVDLSAAKPAPLASLGARWMPARAGVGAAFAATIVGARNDPLSSGSVRYWRWPLAIGPAYRFAVGSASWDVHAGAALAWFHVAGVGFSSARTHDALLGGGFVATRASGSWNGLEPFVDAAVFFWRPTEAFVQRDIDAPSVRLPALELHLGVGAALRAW